MGKQWKQWDFIFLASRITADCDCSHEIKRCLLFWRKAMTNQDSILKSRDITDKGPYSQSFVYSSSHVWMWELDHKKGWAWKNWCFKLWCWRRFLDCMEIKQVISKGNQPWIFIGKTDAEAEAAILWPPNEKSWLIGKDTDAGKDWRRRGQERVR